jgi:hypothetical protein
LYLSPDQGGGIFADAKLPISVVGESAFNLDAVGTATTPTLFLSNATAATAGLQQNSPAFRFSGSGFAATPAASKDTVWSVFAEQLIGTSLPTSSIQFMYSVDGSVPLSCLRVTGLGQLIAPASISAGTNINALLDVVAGDEVVAGTSVSVPTSGKYNFLSRTILGASAVGSMTIYDNVFSGIASLHLGGDTSSFPSIRRNGIILEFVAADGAAKASTALYNTKTSSTNFERLTNEWDTNVCRLWTEKGSGGGTARDFVLGADATEVLRFNSATATFTKSAIGVTPTDALIFLNSTAAAAGSQQFSTGIRWSSFGWGTTGGTSQQVDWRMYDSVTQSTVPVGSLKFDAQVDGAGYDTVLQISNLGSAKFFSSGTSGQIGLSLFGDTISRIAFDIGSGFGGGARLGFGDGTAARDVLIQRLAANSLIIAQTTVPCSLGICNTLSSATSYEMVRLSWAANVAQVWTEKGSGGGSARAMVLGADSTELMRFEPGSALSFYGVAAVTRPSVPDGSSLATVIDALQALGLFNTV